MPNPPLTQKSPSWFVYIIESTDHKFYTGITTNVSRRMKEHQSLSKGAKFFRLAKPKKIVFLKDENCRSSASKLEYKIKKLTRVNKINLIESSENRISTLLSAEI